MSIVLRIDIKTQSVKAVVYDAEKNAQVEMRHQEEGAAFGPALRALAVLEETELTSLVKEHLDRDSNRCCEPDPSTVIFYDEAYFQQRQSVEQIASIYRN